MWSLCVVANRKPNTTGGGGGGGGGLGGGGGGVQFMGNMANAVKEARGQVGGVLAGHARREHWSPPPKLTAVHPLVARHFAWHPRAVTCWRLPRLGQPASKARPVQPIHSTAVAADVPSSNNSAGARKRNIFFCFFCFGSKMIDDDFVDLHLHLR